MKSVLTTLVLLTMALSTPVLADDDEAAAAAAKQAEVDKRKGKPKMWAEVEVDPDAAAVKKSKVGAFQGGEPLPPDFKFPWMPVLFSTAFLLIALPFGVRMFRNTSKEISQAEEGFEAVGGGRKNDDE
jgi:hypothetical protein